MLERVRLIKSEGRDNRKPWKHEKNDIVQTVRGEGESAQRLQKKLRLEYNFKKIKLVAAWENTYTSI